MREELLHFIWEFRYFNHRELSTEAGEPLFIHRPGDRNTHQGPDFRNARITIGDIPREGPVELHLRTSDWHRHGHTGDPHYRDTILHVVWENDTTDPPAGIPILMLRDRTPKLLLSRYQHFMAGQSFVPCEGLLSAPNSALIPWAAFRQTLITQRLQARTRFIASLLESNSQHWELTTWWLIMRSLGQPVNTELFLTIARSLPLTMLLRHRTNLMQLEALLLGQAGLLGKPGPLEKEYRFLKNKYTLTPIQLPLSFLRMRPAHQPNIRLKQLAAMLHRYSGWFTPLLEADDPPGAKTNVLINAFIPLLFAYGTLRQEPRQREKALRWLESLPPEDNSIIRRWRQLGMTARTAADTQALLELKKNYCSGKKCLDCAIGQALLTPDPPSPASENLP